MKINNQLKVLVITNLFPNNQEPNRGVFVKQSLAELAKLCAVRVIAPVPWFPLDLKMLPRWSVNSKIVHQEEISGIVTYHPRWLAIPGILRSLYGLLFFFSVFIAVLRLRREFKFDLIYGQWLYPDGFASVIVAKLLNKPIVLHGRGCDVNYYTKFFLRRQFIKWSLKKANAVIAVSRALKKEIQNLGVPESKITVILNGIDTDLFFPMDKNQCRKKLGLSLEKKIILFVGSLESVKGIEYLLDAFKAMVKDYRRDLMLFILGHGSLESKIKTIISDSQINSAVSITGEVAHSQVPLWINASDVVCLPSLREGTPNVILEALACAKPVVATKVGGLEDIVSPQAGLLISTKDAKILAEAVIKVLEGNYDRSDTKSNIVLSWQKHAQQIHDLLNSKK